MRSGSYDAAVTELPLEDAQSLVRAVVALTAMAQRALPARNDDLVARLRDHLGVDGNDADGAVPNTSMTLPVIDRPNLQRALDALAAGSDRWEVLGLNSDVGHYNGLSLPSMVAGTWDGPGLSARQYEAVEIGIGETMPCLKAGIVLTEHEGSALAALVYIASDFPPRLVVEVVGGDDPAAVDGFLAELRRLVDVHNVFRGQIVTFSYSVHGQFGIHFTRVPDVAREHVVLPDGDLAAIEEHAMGITEHADALRAVGQHVKRGLLLYGPPGTGKSHTIAYLLGRMAGRTTIILSGAAVEAVGQAGSIARQLQPATIVIEDVDLIGMDRGLPGGEHNPLLFQLLNEMDGLAGDADVLFVLTTNRVDILEPALAARPGRIDQAIEIGLPDDRARRRLLELYVGDDLDDLDEPTTARVVARTAGVAPAFVKELGRRAALTRLRTGQPSSASLEHALDAMLEHATPILRRSLAGPTAGA